METLNKIDFEKFYIYDENMNIINIDIELLSQKQHLEKYFEIVKDVVDSYVDNSEYVPYEFMQNIKPEYFPKSEMENMYMYLAEKIISLHEYDLGGIKAEYLKSQDYAKICEIALNECGGLIKEVDFKKLTPEQYLQICLTAINEFNPDDFNEALSYIQINHLPENLKVYDNSIDNFIILDNRQKVYSYLAEQSILTDPLTLKFVDIDNLTSINDFIKLSQLALENGLEEYLDYENLAEIFQVSRLPNQFQNIDNGEVLIEELKKYQIPTIETKLNL